MLGLFCRNVIEPFFTEWIYNHLNFSDAVKFKCMQSWKTVLYGDGCPPKQPQFQATHASALPGSASINNNRPWVSKPECRRLVIQTELVFLFSRQKENYNWMRRIQLRLSFTSHFRIHKSHSLWDYRECSINGRDVLNGPTRKLSAQIFCSNQRVCQKNCLVHHVVFFD